MHSITYIQNGFLTIEQLARATGVSTGRIKQMMGAGCLPGPAYEVLMDCSIRSVFGEHDEQHSVDYYPSSHIGKIKRLSDSQECLTDLSAIMKQDFFETYVRVLEAATAQDYGLAHLFDGTGKVAGAAATSFLEAEWQHYLDGTYGLCTRTASFEDIALKEVMIARIKWSVDKITAGEQVDRNQLAEAVDELDRVSSPFAPHERARSSRGKWIDDIRARFLEPAVLP